MKKLVVFALLSVMMIAYSGKTQAAGPQKNTVAKDRVEVMYFHGKQRCVTCRAIEKATKEVLDTYFVNEVKSGKIQYRIIDISQPVNEKVADKYEVSWSSLFVNKWKKDLTEFAFSYAKSSPAQFKAGLKKKIDELLKQK